MFSEAPVSRKPYGLRLPVLDLWGVGAKYDRRHIRISNVRQIRRISSEKGRSLLRLQYCAPICSLTRCLRRCRVLFAVALASARSKAGAPSSVRCKATFTFMSLRRIAPERRFRPLHRFVLPVQPAARQTQRIADRDAKFCQDTNFTVRVDSFFSTFFRNTRRGKNRQEFSVRYVDLRKMTDKLLAGISTISSRASAFFCASGARSCSRSRTPQLALRDFRPASKAALEGAV